MPRPKNRDELLSLSSENYTKLFDLVNSFSDEEIHNAYIFDNNRDKNIRDILVHLHHWHLMMMEWHKVGMSGEKPDMPSLGYTWKTVPALNKEIWKKYQSVSYEKGVKLLDASFKDIQEIIKSHTDEELFEKKKYKWTGTTSMGSYFISATSSHYDWAMKLLRKYKRSLK